MLPLELGILVKNCHFDVILVILNFHDLSFISLYQIISMSLISSGCQSESELLST